MRLRHKFAERWLVPDNNWLCCDAHQGIACGMLCVTNSIESWKSHQSYKSAVLRMPNARALVWELVTRFGEYCIDKVPPRQLPFDVITPGGLVASGLFVDA